MDDLESDAASEVSEEENDEEDGTPCWLRARKSWSTTYPYAKPPVNAPRAPRQSGNDALCTLEFTPLKTRKARLYLCRLGRDRHLRRPRSSIESGGSAVPKPWARGGDHIAIMMENHLFLHPWAAQPLGFTTAISYRLQEEVATLLRSEAKVSSPPALSGTCRPPCGALERPSLHARRHR